MSCEPLSDSRKIYTRENALLQNSSLLERDIIGLQLCEEERWNDISKGDIMPYYKTCPSKTEFHWICLELGSKS